MEVALAAFTALGYALSARAILLLVLVGAFVLALLAMASQTREAIAVLIAYCLLAVLPTVYLEIRKR